MANKGMRDMTAGSPVGHILAFGLPLMLGSLLQQLYNVVDSWVVGNYVSNAALAAVGLAYPIMYIYQCVFLGIGSGGTVTIAQWYGAGRMDKVRDAVDTLSTTFVVGILPLTAAALALVGPMMRIMQVDESAWRETWLYLTIISAGLVGSIGYNITAGILAGVGNSKSTLIFLSVSSAVNILLDLALVLWFDLGVMGVALATIFAQACSWLFSLFYVNRKYPDIRIRLFCFRFDRELFRQIMGIGIPTGIQTAMQAVGVMAVMSLANGFGEDFMAGYNVGSKIDSVTFMFIQCVSSAATAYVGQNVGARKLDRVHRGIRAAVGLAVVWCLITMAVILPARELLVGFFSPDPAVLYGGSSYLKPIMIGYPLFAVMFVMNAALRGTGDSRFPMVTTVVGMIVLRIPFVYWFADLYGPGAMFWGFLPGWAVAAAMALWNYFSGRWKKYLPKAEESL